MGSNEQVLLQVGLIEEETRLDPRELAQVLHAMHYAGSFANAGVPGHGQFLLIAKLAMKIDRLRALLLELANN